MTARFHEVMLLVTRVWQQRLLALMIIVLLGLFARASARDDSSAIDFSSQIAPILQKHCFRCHGGSESKGGLRLDRGDFLRTGGDSGVVVEAGKSSRSELIRRLQSSDASERMPQSSPSLDVRDIALIKNWIDQGADWPDNFEIVASPPPLSSRADANHWAFQPIQRPAVPLANCGRQLESFSRMPCAGNGIDAFVLRRLHQAGMTPQNEADRVTLIRRVTLDLIGLPPTPEEIDEFLNDDQPGAYERIVDRLLCSPQYGEKWARPWLDLCHYADTDGYLTDQLRPVAWRYRAWLVEALNQNMPFDQFTIEQIAGDLLPDATIEQRMATGFLRQTLSNREGGADLEEFRVKQVVDRVQLIGTTWLGLTVGCARCHDHKYDPLSQQEFFEFYACFNNADEVNVDAPLSEERDQFLKSRSQFEQIRKELIEPYRGKLEALQRRWEARCLHAWKNPGKDHIWDRQWEVLGLVWGGHLGEGQLEGVEIMKLDWAQRTRRQQDDLLDYFLRRGSIVDAQQFKQLKLGELQKQLVDLKQQFPQATRAPIMQAGLTPRRTYIHERGDFRDHGPVVRPSTPKCLPAWKTSGDDPRMSLARWLVFHGNPLTARVTVNRNWQELFGRGLVLTSEDFGARGNRPSHPGLLDWLASEFMRSDWDVKSLHRLLVTSAAYRRSSAPRKKFQKLDPNNVLLARQNSLRVSSETIRDMGLAVSGLLCTKMHGPSVKPPQPERVTMEAFGYNDWKPSPAPDRYRRGLYTFIIRTAPFAQSATFDAPNPNEICTRRIRSNTPLQALTLLNDPVFFEMAQSMADRVLRSKVTRDERLEFAFHLCLSRSPDVAERRRLHQYLTRQVKHFVSNPEAAQSLIDPSIADDSPAHLQAAWTNVCSVLLNLHEFITRD